MRAAGKGGAHISGAEGLYTGRELLQAVNECAERALAHTRGAPESVVITLEKLSTKPLLLKALPVSTLKCGSPGEADEIAGRVLLGLGVSGSAVSAALKVLRADEAMRGAAIIDAKTGKRLEPDRHRGVRTSRMGISKGARTALSKRLAPLGLNTSTVREALVLATKVAFARGVVAELCISDDPGYTTGYIASKSSGYQRIPRIKHRGSLHGGRAVFVKGSTNIPGLIDYLQERPVMVTGVSGVIRKVVKS